MAQDAFYDIYTTEIKNIYPSIALEPVINQGQKFRPKLSKSLPPGAKKGAGVIKFPAYLATPRNTAQVADQSDLPPSKNRTSALFTLLPTTFVGKMEIGWQTNEAANDSESAFAGGEIKRSTEETLADTGKNIEQVYVGTASDGIRGYVESDGSNLFVVKLPYGVKLIRPNDYISARIAAGSTVRDSFDGYTVSSTDRDTRTVYYTGTDRTLVANDPIYMVSQTSMTLTNVFANGLRGLIDDGTNGQYIHGLDRTTTANIRLRSIVYDAGTLVNLSESILLTTAITVEDETQKSPELIMCSQGQGIKYAEFVAPQRRFPVQGKSETQAFTQGVDFDDLTFVAPGVKMKFLVSQDVLFRELYLLNMSTFFHYLAKPMSWNDKMMMVPTPSANGGFISGYTSIMYSVENLGNFYPRGNAVIRNLRDPLCGD